MTLVAGIDSSTQSTKVEVRDLADGAVVATGVAKHPPTTPPVSEQSPDAWWAAVVEAFDGLGRCRRDVVAVAVAGQQHGLVLLDDDGAPLRPAKLWNDTTSSPNAEALVAALGADHWATATGTVPVASITVTKLAWVAEHEPHLLDRVARVMLPHDYLTWRLSGAHVTDRGDASGTGWFDGRTDTYLPELIGAAVGGAGDTWIGRLPRVLGPAERAGTVTAEAAAELGLGADVAVGPGSGDNMGAALGLGLAAGDLAISLGTSGVVFAVSDTPTSDPSGAVAGFASASGNFLPLVCTLNATKVTDTVARWLGTDPPGLAELALATADGPGDVMLVPYFDGERTPNLPAATGSIAGLTNATTREQLALAAHDGVLCGLFGGVDALRAAGASVDGRVFLVGGGSRSIAYRQRAADLLESPVTVPHTDETVATGAAVQAAMVVSGRSPTELAADWRLGSGVEIEPGRDAGERRTQYAALAAEVAARSSDG